MLKGKSSLEHTNLFTPSDHDNNDKKNTKMFSIIKKMKRLYCVICSNHGKSGKSKIIIPVRKNISSFYFLQ